MTFLSLLVALGLEQAWPARYSGALREVFLQIAQVIREKLDGGAEQHGMVAWIAVVLVVTVLTAIVGRGMAGLGPLAVLLWSVAVLYLTIGFRQFSQEFAEIRIALREGNLSLASERLGAWQGGSVPTVHADEIARVAIERGLVAAQRHVFGPLFWFVVLGPAGAVFYRAADLIAQEWAPQDGSAGVFGRFASRAFEWIDWVPARVTAACFAVVGNFEDAAYCWRTQAAAWAPSSDGVILAAGAGAMGVRLGDSLRRADDSLVYRPELGLGEEADADFMESAVGLVWRALVVAMFFVFVVSVARAFG